MGQSLPPHSNQKTKTTQIKKANKSKDSSVVYNFCEATPTQRKLNEFCDCFLRRQAGKLDLGRIKVGLRDFIEQLQKKGELTKITKPVSTEYEMAGIIAALGEKPIYFENVKESSYPVVAGLVSSKELICRSMGITKEQLLPKLLSAIEHPVPPQMVQTAPCQEVVETDVDLTKLPIMHYTEKDGGDYIASAVSIVKDPELGRNMCFHRLMLLDKNRFVARIVEHRGTDTALKKAGGELDIAICLGNSTATLLAAATTLPMGADELGMANALEKTDLVKCKTVDLEVPANCEFVLEGRITQEKAAEGPFLDLTGIIDRVRQQPVVEIKCVTHRKDAIYQTILAGKNEHKFLMGMPKEINIYDPQDVEWAIATRFQADKNTIILSNQPGSSLDPSGDLSEGKKATTAKAGLDATAPLVTTGKGFQKQDYIKVDLNKYL